MSGDLDRDIDLLIERRAREARETDQDRRLEEAWKKSERRALALLIGPDRGEARG